MLNMFNDGNIFGTFGELGDFLCKCERVGKRQVKVLDRLYPVSAVESMQQQCQLFPDMLGHLYRQELAGDALCLDSEREDDNRNLYPFMIHFTIWNRKKERKG